MPGQLWPETETVTVNNKYFLCIFLSNDLLIFQKKIKKVLLTLLYMLCGPRNAEATQNPQNFSTYALSEQLHWNECATILDPRGFCVAAKSLVFHQLWRLTF